MLGKLVNTSIGQNVLVLRPLAQMELLALLPVIWRDRVYLKRLDIKGFKSFAEYTTIHFEPGINIVVGPNGCGKSNIVDAVRWVLGENNVRNLRGSKGEDGISAALTANGLTACCGGDVDR